MCNSQTVQSEAMRPDCSSRLNPRTEVFESMIEDCSCLFEVYVEDGGLESHVHAGRTSSDWLSNTSNAVCMLRVRVGACMISIKII